MLGFDVLINYGLFRTAPHGLRERSSLVSINLGIAYQLKLLILQNKMIFGYLHPAS